MSEMRIFVICVALWTGLTALFSFLQVSKLEGEERSSTLFNGWWSMAWFIWGCLVLW